MENLFVWVVVGIVAGWLAKVAMPGEAPGGILGDFIVGIFGAVIGSYLFNVLAGVSYGGWFGNIAVAFVGSVLLLVFLRALNSRRIFAW